MIKRLLVLTFALLGIALLTTPATGGGCRAVVRRSYYTPYVAPIVEKAVVIEKVIEAVPTYLAQFIPVPVLTYGANYVPGAPPAAQAPQQGYAATNGNDPILAALQRLEGRLGNLEKAAGIAPPPATGSPPEMSKAQNGQAAGGAFLKRHCAACHEASVAKRDGGGHVWLTGDALAPLTPEQRLRMISRVRTGAMPPPDNNKGIKPPTDQEFDAFLEEMTK